MEKKSIRVKDLFKYDGFAGMPRWVVEAFEKCKLVFMGPGHTHVMINNSQGHVRADSQDWIGTQDDGEIVIEKGENLPRIWLITHISWSGSRVVSAHTSEQGAKERKKMHEDEFKRKKDGSNISEVWGVFPEGGLELED